MVATKQGKLFLLAVDGRAPGHSDGMTLAEGARYLLSLGMENAINIDGGGSTTYYVRKPGEQHPVLLNRPSDGHDRAVGNALAILSTKVSP
jgi:exopolysaccharide biosynthesis protein